MSGLVNIVCQTFDRGSQFRFNQISPQACYLDFPSSRRTHQIIGFIYLAIKWPRCSWLFTRISFCSAVYFSIVNEFTFSSDFYDRQAVCVQLASSNANSFTTASTPCHWGACFIDKVWNGFDWTKKKRWDNGTWLVSARRLNQHFFASDDLRISRESEHWRLKRLIAQRHRPRPLTQIIKSGTTKGTS